MAWQKPVIKIKSMLLNIWCVDARLVLRSSSINVVKLAYWLYAIRLLLFSGKVFNLILTLKFLGCFPR